MNYCQQTVHHVVNASTQTHQIQPLYSCNVYMTLSPNVEISVKWSSIALEISYYYIRIGIWKLSSTPVVNLLEGRLKEYQDMSLGEESTWDIQGLLFLESDYCIKLV